MDKASPCEKTILSNEFLTAKWNNEVYFFLLVPAKKTYSRRKQTQCEVWGIYQMLVHQWKLLPNQGNRPIQPTYILPADLESQQSRAYYISELDKNYITFFVPGT